MDSWLISPLIKTIEVPCSQETAFNVFVNEMDSWWPLSIFTVSAMAGGVARAVRVEPKPGGTIVEVGHDGAEHLWGTIKTYDPHDLFSMDFHIPQPGEVVEGRSLVEVRFTALEDDRTQVVLTQSNWEALGEYGPMLRGGYDGGWDAIFGEAFKAACGV